MRYLSLFSGIEAASVAWHDFGTPVAFSEIEPFPCAVLAHHYPGTPNLGDITKITEQQIKDLGPIEVVVFGAPCQDLSVAGKRAGLRDADGNITRSGLFFTAIKIVNWARKHCGLRFALYENVPGAFSSNKGADFTEVVKHMAGLEDLGTPANGWGTEGCALGTQLVEWAVLDSQWFGVAQRRRRVFALADFGDWTNRPPILLEPESLRGDSPPSREARQETSRSTSDSTGSGSVSRVDDRGFHLLGSFSAGFSAGNSSGSRGIGFTEEGTPPLRAGASGTNQVPTIIQGTYECGGIGAYSSSSISSPLLKTGVDLGNGCEAIITQQTVYGGGENRDVAHCLRSGASKADKHESTTYVLQHAQIGRKDSAGQQGKGWQKDVSSTLDSRPCADAAAYAPIAWSEELTASVDVAGTIQYGGQEGRHDGVMTPTCQVRRLLPVECARLQGFPDDYLDIQFCNKAAADGHKYKALGNSMAVPVMRYIGLKINSVLNYDWVEDLF